MNYIDISSDNKDSVTMEKYGTETSATSSFIPPQMNGGGWSLFGGNENNQKAIQACKEHEFGALSFLIRHDMVTDYSVQDSETGFTILHCIAKHYSKVPEIQDVLTKILTNSSVHSFINIQDKNGDTPLHAALSNGNQLLCNLLIKAGANPRIRNKMNKYIATDDEYSIMGSETSPDIPSICKMSPTSASVFAPKTEERFGLKRIKGRGGPKYRTSDIENSDVNDIVNMLLLLSSRQQPRIEYSTDMPSTLKSTDVDVTSELFNTEKFLNEIIASRPMKQMNVSAPSSQRIMSRGQSPPSQQTISREQLNLMPYNLQSSRLQESDINLIGGSNTKTIISGSRRMNLYSEFEDLMGGWDPSTKTSDRRGNETSDEYTTLKQTYRDSNRSTAIRDNESDMDDYRQISRTPRSRSKPRYNPRSNSRSNSRQSSRVSDSGKYEEDLDYEYDSSKDYDQRSETRSLSRQIRSQVDQIHERTVEKIKAIMNVDTDIARNYKAVLYRRVKEEHPELGGYERALEMERLATKENLEKIDINKVTQEIKEYLEKKHKEDQKSVNTDTSQISDTSVDERTKKRRAPRKKTDTSSVSVVSETGLSPTSDDW